jgi:hypothetical protein
MGREEPIPVATMNDRKPQESSRTEPGLRKTIFCWH